MKRFLIITLLPFSAHAENGLLVSDTQAESTARHAAARQEEYQARPMGAPYGGYSDERFGDSAPAGTPRPGYVTPAPVYQPTPVIPTMPINR